MNPQLPGEWVPLSPRCLSVYSFSELPWGTKSGMLPQQTFLCLWILKAGGLKSGTISFEGSGGLLLALSPFLVALAVLWPEDGSVHVFVFFGSIVSCVESPPFDKDIICVGFWD